MVNLTDDFYKGRTIHGGDIYSARKKLEAGRKDTALLDFSANVNPLGLPEQVKKAIMLAIDRFDAYPDPLCRELIAGLSAYEAVPASWLLCGNGAADLIYRLVWARKPQKAMVLAPTFAEYEEALKTINCQVVRYYLKAEKAFKIDEGFLEQLEQENGLDILFLCNPNNPTGQLMSKESILKIVERCKARNILCVLDECFNELLDEPDTFTAKEYLGEFDNLLIIRAFTKIYAMAGIRLGYCMTSNQKVLQGLMEAGQPWSVSAVAQIAGIQAMQEEEYLIKTKELLGRERQYLIHALEELGIIVICSSANYIFIEWPYKTSLTLDEMLLQYGILIRNCANYSGLKPGYYRMCIRAHESNVILIKALKDLQMNLTGSKTESCGMSV